MTRWMFIFAHMDDEVISAHSLINKHQSKILICTNGIAKGYQPRMETFNSMWNCETAILDHPDESLWNYSPALLADEIKEHLVQFQPEVIVTHYSKDLHFEHRAVSEATRVAARRVKSVKSFYEAFNQESSIHATDRFNVIHELTNDELLAKDNALDKYRELGYMLQKPLKTETLRLIYASI